MTTARCRRRAAASFLMAVGAMMTMHAAVADDLWRALSGGKPDLYLRYRFENVDDGQQPKLSDAYANTLRSALGYSTGLYHGFGLYAQLEDVRVLGDEDFNDGGGNGYATRAVVVDPEGTEIQQANLRYRGLPKTQLWLGRQEIEHRQASNVERRDIAEYYLGRVGLGSALERMAAELSNGMQQRVGIARAFALSPKLLLLDEPFGMLDSLTRWDLQEVLMDVLKRTQVTTICITHDVDEAILLADRVVMMSNGPQARVGHIMAVDLPQPRTRQALLTHPRYYELRREVLEFLNDHDHPPTAVPLRDAHTAGTKRKQAA